MPIKNTSSGSALSVSQLEFRLLFPEVILFTKTSNLAFRVPFVVTVRSKLRFLWYDLVQKFPLN